MSTYKYLTVSRINSTIKKHNLQVAYTKGQKEFRFVDLTTGEQVGEPLVMDRLHSITIQQWRDAAEAARATTPLTATQEAAKAVRKTAAQVRELVAELA